MQFHINKTDLFLTTIFCTIVVSANKMACKEFNVELIIPLELVYLMVSFFKVSLIFMHMQMRYFSYRTTG